MNAKQVIEHLKLEPLTVEGGYFKETYRSTEILAQRERCIGTSIYYLLKTGELSRWHRVKSDEIWIYHLGASAIQLLLFADGSWEKRIIGGNLTAGHVPQSIIPAGTWQAAVLYPGATESWGLFGAVVFPGFEYADFEEGTGRELMRLYPGAAADMIELGLD
jgi:predicted cupin superfamily sugar epimerase